MNKTIISIFSLGIFLCFAEPISAGACLQQDTSMAVIKKKRARTIGSAWQQAVQRVYIKGSTLSSAPSAYVSPEPPPAPKPQPPTPHVQQQQSFTPAAQQMHILEPTPEEMALFMSQLQNIFNSVDDDDTDASY